MVFLTMGFSLEENGFEEKREQHERERERGDERRKREKKSHHNSGFFVCLIQIDVFLCFKFCFYVFKFFKN